MSRIEEILDTAATSVEAGLPVAFCVIVATRGSTPQPAGTMLCVDQAARITGTLGGGCIEADIRRRAHQLLAAGQSELLTFRLDSDFGHDDGMICGGEMDVAVVVLSRPDDAGPLREALDRLSAGHPSMIPLRVTISSGTVEYRLQVASPPKLLIAGGGHIARVLAGMMVPLGFRVSVVDDRSRFANEDRFPPPIEPVAGDIAKTLGDWPVDANTYVVIVTRGHKHDEQALRAVVDSPARYVGMIGSRRKIQTIYDDLLRSGVSKAKLADVHAPIGLDLGAVTTAEIALSIAAQLVSVRRRERSCGVEGPFRIAGETP